MLFTPYALPAIVALVVKVGIFFYARYSRIHNLQTQLYLLFLFSLSIQNLTEIQLFVTNAETLTNPPHVSGKTYFSASIFAIAFLLHLSFTMARSWGGRRSNLPFAGIAFIYAPAIVLQVLLWSGPLLVAGFEPMGYTYVKIPGTLYFLFQGYTIGYLVMAPALLFYGSRNHCTPFRRLQNKLFLTGLLPIPILVVTIIVHQQLGFREFNSTVTLPLAVTFFLIVTAYATHQYRLFDIEFFIPWSTVRKRKTEFYKRIQSTIAAIAELRSVREITQLIANTLRCQVALIGGPQAVVARADGQDGENEDLLLSRFPRHVLEKAEHIVVAQESADANPSLHAILRTYRVGAIVPFKSHSTVTTHWLVIGDHFSNEIYTPLDFKVVEELFSALAERFLDDFLFVRSQLAKVQDQLRRTRRNLGLAWHKEHELKKEVGAITTENRSLRDEIAELRRAAVRTTIEPKTSEAPTAGELKLQEYLTECEKQAIITAMNRCGGAKVETACLLGVTPHTLDHLLKRHHIDDDMWIIK